MELFLKRYFWAVPLVFIALACLLVTRTVNTYVGAAIEPAPSVGELAPRPAFAPPPPVVSVDVNRLGHLFGIEPPPPPPPSEVARTEEVNTAVCYTCAPVKTNLRLQLLATMVATPKKYSMAFVSDLDKQETAYFMVGDRIKQAVVYDIIREPQRVIIVNDETHRLEYIDAVPGSGAAVNTAGLGSLGTAPVPAPNGDMASPDGGDGGPVEGVKKLAENKFEITKQKLDSTLGNLNEVATQARIVPSFKNGVANGFKLFSIRPGSIYSAIGIQNGDVITRINGFDMNSPDKALEIYQRLKDSRNIKIEYERRGQMMSSDYNITQ